MPEVAHTSPATRLQRLHTIFVGVAWAVYAVGVAWRFWYILFEHRATDFIYSDMLNYVSVGSKIFSGTPLSISDTIWSPGAAILFGFFGTLAPDHGATIATQFLISAVVPILIFLLTRRLFGRPTAYIALVLASLYFPFIDYSAYFLSEIPFLTLLLLAFLALTHGLETSPIWKVRFLGFATGLFLGVAMAFRSIVLVPGAFALIALLIFFPSAYGWPRILKLLLFGSGGFALAVLPLMFWCSSIAGTFCIGSTNGALTMLQGHWYPGISDFQFYDVEREYSLGFTSPPYPQKGETGELRLYFGPYDQDRMLRLIGSWVHENPLLALTQSVRNVGDLFWGTVPWPSCCNDGKALMVVSQWIWLVFMVIPTLGVLASLPRASARENRFTLLLIAPILGIIVAAFLTVGDPRYRIPFDFIFIMIAAHGYVLAFTVLSRLWQKQKSRRVRAGS